MISSEIGPAEVFIKNQIQPIVDLPVGQNLQTYVGPLVIAHTTKTFSKFNGLVALLHLKDHPIGRNFQITAVPGNVLSPQAIDCFDIPPAGPDQGYISFLIWYWLHVVEVQ